MKTRKLIKDTNASVIPVLLYVLTIFGCGALYTLFFLEIGQPTFDSYIPASDSKTFIMMAIYAIPLFVMTAGIMAMIKSGIKRVTGESY